MKCLYLLHVDWDWIFQRPQIFGLYLDECFDCNFVTIDRLFNRLPKKTSNVKPKHLNRVTILPKSCVSDLIARLNRIILQIAVRNFDQYDLIWVPYPEFYKFLPKNYRGLLVYDCMDDYAEMATSKANALGLTRREDEILRRADVVFVSSEYLMGKIAKRCDLAKIHLVRNGVKTDQPAPVKLPKVNSRYRIGYFGTISTWMDFDALEAVSKQLESISFDLIGPNESTHKSCKNIEIKPPVAHDELAKLASEYDCLAMPFVVSELIKAVDPVKLYEYIAFGNCIISVYYPELDHFSDFVYFYQTSDDLISLVQDLSSKGFPPKYTAEQQTAFLAENSWDKRMDNVKTALRNCYTERAHKE